MQKIGFIGLGVMGLPMAANLARAGYPLMVWNRSPKDLQSLGDAARITQAGSPDAVIGACEITILMLVDQQAIDAVLERGAADFADRVRGRTIICMSSVTPQYSEALAREITRAGGRYIEAPVSGSRGPAEAGELVCLIGAEAALVADVSPILSAMCSSLIHCGRAGQGLRMKLAINLYLTAMLAALAEAANFARLAGVSGQGFLDALSAGPMNSAFATLKLSRMIARDFSLQAAVSDAYASTRLIAGEARRVGASTPLLDVSSALYGEAAAAGDPRADMASVLIALERAGSRPAGSDAA